MGQSPTLGGHVARRGSVAASVARALPAVQSLHCFARLPRSHHSTLRGRSAPPRHTPVADPTHRVSLMLHLPFAPFDNANPYYLRNLSTGVPRPLSRPSLHTYTPPRVSQPRAPMTPVTFAIVPRPPSFKSLPLPPSPRRYRARTTTPPTMRITRRTFLHTAPLVLPLLLAESGNIQAELSALASKIPGVGMPDIFYPPFLLGEWLVTRELYAVEVQPHAQDIPGHSLLSHLAIDAQREMVGQRATFPAHFVDHRSHVIEDRRFNARAELAADDVSWQPDNPNVLSITWGRTPGSKRIRECKVTKRSFVDAPQGYGTFVSSEYARVVDVPSQSSFMTFSKRPSVYARRRLVRYKVSSVTDKMVPDGMDRIVIDYIYPPSPPDAKYALLLKYRDFLIRRTSRLQ
ncbi:unnamed protein product [Agarophyton chilense]